MNDKEKWRERVRDIRASGTTWWWWYLMMIINKYILYMLYIYLIHGKYCFASSGFLKFITTFIRQLRRWNEIENRKCDKYRQWSKIRQNTDKKPLRFRLYVVVSMCVYGCGCMCERVDACFYVKSGQEIKALIILEIGYECVYICFVGNGTNCHRCKL